MKKTVLTMTDSEKASSDSHSKTPQEENQALRIIIEQQEIAMDMIMRKYREHIDSLTKVSHFDVRKLFYKRFLDTIVKQATKMDDMTKMMRKNLLIIFKYEDVMRQIESENESMRSLVKKLTLAVKEAEKKAEIVKVMKNDVGSQTLTQGNAVPTADKSVETEKADGENHLEGSRAPKKQDKCTDMIPYTPISDRFVYFGRIHNTLPPTKSLDVDAAFDLYVNRFCEESKNPSLESESLSNLTSTEIAVNLPSEEVSEDSSEDLASSTRALLIDVDEISSENSIVSLVDDSCSKDDPTDDG